MKRIALVLTIGSSILISGCATYSFAPPLTNLDNPVSAKTKNGCNLRKKSEDDLSVKSVENAQKLIENFLYAYRCDALQLADGRQDFEVPALLSVIGGATAAALGTGRDVAIATGATASLFNAGKGYYDPIQKRRIVQAGWAAILCIQSESNDITPTDLNLPKPPVDALRIQSFFPTDAAGQADARAAIRFEEQAATDTQREVKISLVERYYTMVKAALVGVEHIVAERLSSVGSYSADALITEIKAIETRADEAASAANRQSEQTSPTAKRFGALGDSVAEVIIDLDKLQPKLDACVVKVKG